MPTQFAWSFSQMNNYRTCPKRWYHYNVAKDVKEPTNDQMRWGFQVHDSMAARISKATPLPPTMPYEHWVNWAMQNVDFMTCTISAEQKMALTPDFQPCTYFDRNKHVWFRTVLDVVKINIGNCVARIIDWKTGKVPENPMKRMEADQQLWLSATAIFASYPQMQLVRCNLVYLQEDTPTTLVHKDIKRTDLPALWQQVTPTLTGMQEALRINEFPPNPSGLCKKHCVVTSCPYHGKGRY